MENKEIDNFFDNNIGQDENVCGLTLDKSVDVFNALSLVSTELGQMYEKDGYNPFDDDFVLTEDYTMEVLAHKINAQDIFTEDFLQQNNKTVAKHFNTALKNNEIILNSLNEELQNTSDQKVKDQIKKTIVFLKNRNELLKLNIGKLKQKDANAIKMYIEMFGMDSELSELLKETYNDKVNTQHIVQQMLAALTHRAQNVKAKLKNISIKQGATLDEVKAEVEKQVQNEMQNEFQTEMQNNFNKQPLQEIKEEQNKEQNDNQKENKENSEEQDFSY